MTTGPVLVLVDHADGTPRGSALELLTAARGLGEAQAVWIGDLPDDAASSQATFRVVFLPKNANIPAWTSELVDA